MRSTRLAMKQYTTPEQTAKLIELGFEKPKSISGYYQRGPYEYDAETNTKMVVYDDTQYPIYAYSIGELIELLPDDGVTDRRLEFDSFLWIVDWDSFDKMHQTISVELVDALYDMVVKLKEEGVI